MPCITTGMPNFSADAMVEPGGDPFKEFGDEPPTTGNIDAPAFPAYGHVDLEGCFCRGCDPESWSFGHFCIDEAGLDIGEIEGDLHFSGLDVQAFEVDALEGLAGAIGR